MPDVRDKLIKAGAEAVTSTPDELSQRIADATQRCARIIQALGIKPQ